MPKNPALPGTLSSFLRDSSRFLENLPFLGPNLFAKSSFKKFLINVGWLTIGYWVAKFSFRFFPTLLSLYPRKLTTRYGAKSFVVITGACNNLGKSFAEEFAQNGFNLVLIDEDFDKLSSLKSNLIREYDVPEIKLVQADFRKCLDEDFYEKLNLQLHGLDISILVNNLSVKVTGELVTSGNEELKKMILYNTVPMVRLSQNLVKGLRLRKKRSAIINVSSYAGAIPTPYMACYSATKAFVDFFSRGLAMEYLNLDIISLRPPFQNTKIEGNIDDSHPMNSCVKACLRNLGRRDYVSGDFSDTFWNWVSKSQNFWSPPAKPDFSFEVITESDVSQTKKN